MRPSDRYAWALVALFALALIPVVMHHGIRLHHETCANETKRVNLFGLEGSVGVKERAERLTSNLVQFTEGSLPLDGRRDLALDFSVVRSFEPSRLYVRPSNFVPMRMEPERHEIEWVDSDGERLPIQWIYDHTRPQVQFAAYLFVYEGEPVARPFTRQLASALTQLWQGTRPLTLLIVHGLVDPADFNAAQTRARSWLTQARRLEAAECGS